MFFFTVQLKTICHISMCGPFDLMTLKMCDMLHTFYWYVPSLKVGQHIHSWLITF